VNKTELTQALAKKFELSISKTTEIMSYTLALLYKALVKIGFGSFSIRKCKTRKVRNPKLATIKIPVNKTVKFSVGMALKNLINKNIDYSPSSKVVAVEEIEYNNLNL